MTAQKLYRSDDDKFIGGICGGLGEYFDIDPTILRLAWVIITIFSGLMPGTLIYIVAFFIIPQKPNTDRSIQSTVIEVRGRINEK